MCLRFYNKQDTIVRLSKPIFLRAFDTIKMKYFSHFLKKLAHVVEMTSED